MSDIDNYTNDSTLYDEEGNPVRVVKLSGEGFYRLSVDANITGISLDVVSDVRTLGQKLADDDKMFVTALDFVTIADMNENDLILLRNPASSGVDMRIRDFIAISSKAANPSTFRVYKAPTITTDGTALVENNLRDLSVASAINAFKLPTISARGTLLQVFGLVGQAEFTHEEFMQMFILEGEDLLLTIEPNSANQSFALTVTWGEQDIPA